MIARNHRSPECIAAFDRTFFAERFEREWVYVPHDGTWDPGTIIRSSDFEYLAIVPPGSSRTNLRASRVRSQRECDEMAIETGVTASALAALFRDGYTLICDEASARWPAIHKLCETVKDAARRFAPAAVRAHATCGLFLTPPAAQGLALHHDLQHVFAIQLEGRKTWRLYEPIVANATTNSAPEFYRESPPLLAEITLHPGDALYVPRGLPHEVVTSNEEHSLHMSIGLTALTWSDVLVPLLQQHAVLRRSIPTFVTDADVQAACDAVVSALTPKAFVEHFEAIVLADRMRVSQHGRGILHDAVAGALHSPFMRRFDDYTVRAFEGSTVVGFPGGVMRFPIGWLERLEALLARDVIDEESVRTVFALEDADLLMETFLRHHFLRSVHDD